MWVSSLIQQSRGRDSCSLITGWSCFSSIATISTASFLTCFFDMAFILSATMTPKIWKWIGRMEVSAAAMIQNPPLKCTVSPETPHTTYFRRKIRITINTTISMTIVIPNVRQRPYIRFLHLEACGPFHGIAVDLESTAARSHEMLHSRIRHLPIEDGASMLPLIPGMLHDASGDCMSP